jgi:hypothetical protein
MTLGSRIRVFQWGWRPRRPDQPLLRPIMDRMAAIPYARRSREGRCDGGSTGGAMEVHPWLTLAAGRRLGAAGRPTLMQRRSKCVTFQPNKDEFEPTSGLSVSGMACVRSYPTLLRVSLTDI